MEDNNRKIANYNLLSHLKRVSAVLGFLEYRLAWEISICEVYEEWPSCIFAVFVILEGVSECEIVK